MNSIPNREWLVLQGIKDGKSERSIALDMGCSVHNVKAAKQKLFNRWAVSTQAALVSEAYQRLVLTVEQSPRH